MTTTILETGPMLRRAIQQGLDTGQRAVCPWCGERELSVDAATNGTHVAGAVFCEACGLEYQEEIHR